MSSENLEQLITTVAGRAGLSLYWVGGTVRDRLLNRSSHDWDFVCRGAERAARAVARRLPGKCITLDEQFRIYRVVPRKPVEGVLTIDFAEMQGRSVEQDLSRRDFTVNAMAMRLGSVQLIDPYQGQRDLQRRTLRVVSRKALVEDPLRLLRAYRISTQLGLRIEPRTAVWLKAEHKRLMEARGGVARERVREELLRLLSQQGAAQALTEMDRSGLLTVVWPELESGRRVGVDYYGRGGVLRHHLESVANVEWILNELQQPDKWRFLKDQSYFATLQQYVRRPVGGFPCAVYLKLAALLHDIGKPATAEVIRGRLRFFGHEDVGGRMVQKVLSGLRFSRQEIGLIASWVRNHMRPGSLASGPQLTDKAIARFFRDLGEDAIGMLIISLGDHYTYLARKEWGQGRDPVEQTARRLLDAYFIRRERVLPPRLIDGHLLMKKLRIKPGPLVGKLLDTIRDGQAEGKVRTLDEALALAAKAVKKVR
jgi:poly(A) polymerase